MSLCRCACEADPQNVALMQGLALAELTLSHFRSHKQGRIICDHRPIALFGNNGAGKTNILEAEKKQCIYFEYRNFSKENFELVSQLKPFDISLKSNSFFYKKNDRKIKNKYKESNIWQPSNLDGDIIFIN